MRNIEILKSFLKQLACKIKTDNAILKKSRQNGYPESLFRYYGDSYTFRHFLIAYCELRGRTREQIEIPHKDNLPNETLIKQIKDKYAWSSEEIEIYNARKEKYEALRSCA
jgi:hypothetical protein